MIFGLFAGCCLRNETQTQSLPSSPSVQVRHFHLAADLPNMRAMLARFLASGSGTMSAVSANLGRNLNVSMAIADKPGERPSHRVKIRWQSRRWFSCSSSRY